LAISDFNRGQCFLPSQFCDDAKRAWQELCPPSAKKKLFVFIRVHSCSFVFIRVHSWFIFFQGYSIWQILRSFGTLVRYLFKEKPRSLYGTWFSKKNKIWQTQGFA